MTYPELRQIRIDENLGRQAIEVTFMHEILHACAEFVGMRDEEEKLTEEQWVDRIAATLHMVLVENGIFCDSKLKYGNIGGSGTGHVDSKL